MPDDQRDIGSEGKTHPTKWRRSERAKTFCALPPVPPPCSDPFAGIRDDKNIAREGSG
jgi:hypothetical protein